jgi:MFS family permease
VSTPTAEQSLAEIDPRQARINARFAYGGAIVAMTGIQLIAPSIPLMGDALDLTDAELALITSVYLLPAALAAIPAGVLADRIGRRRVFGWAMVLLGLSGAVLQLVMNSFPAFLAVRAFQGTMFAGLMPLTMTILGDAFTGSELIRAHGRRTVSMHIGDGSLPIIGGLAVGLGWRVPWLGQLLAIPFGIAVLRTLVDPPMLRARTKRGMAIRAFVDVFRSPAIAALQYAGFLRMFLKFGVVTFLPVLLVDTRGFSPAFAGAAVGFAALSGILPAMTAGRIALHGRPATFVAIGTLAEGLALALMATSTSSGFVLLAGLVFGLADGLSAVFVNAFVSAATDADQRASFIATTGAIRNFAKFMAPATLGALTLITPLATSFFTIAIITSLSAILAIPLRELEPRLASERNA